MAFICRLCGEDGDDQSNFIYLFDKSKPATDNLNFMKTQLHILVNLEDVITQYICLKCSMVNDHFSRYFEKCQTTQPVLYKKIFETRATPKNEIKTAHHTENDVIEIIDESDDSNQFNNNSADFSQIDTKASEIPTVNSDPVLLPEQLKSEEPTVYDVESDEEVVENEKNISASLREKRCFQCSICKEIKSNRKALSDHFRQDHSDISVYCYQCDYVTLFKDRLNQHVKECHDKNFKCDVCHARFRKCSKLKTHYAALHTNGLPINCTLCDKEFKQKYEYQKHERLVHLVDGYWVCHICKEDFVQRHLLELHVMKSHFTDKKMKCPVERCEYYARHKYYMTQHYSDVHDKKFTCQICGKLESKQCRINEHMRRKHTHTPNEELKCPKCKKIFTLKGWYDRHMGGACKLFDYNDEDLAKIQHTIDC